MKIAVSSTAKGLESQASPIFGRCPFFVIVETKENEIKNSKTIENKANSQFSGAGITAAELVGNEDVKIVISGAAGPRAFQVFNKIGIKVFKSVTGTVKENIKKYLAGELDEIETPGPRGKGGRGPGRGRRQK